MKELARYSGVIVMIVGVLTLAIPFFNGTTNNTNLLIGLILVIEGFLGYLYVNNMKKGSIVSNIVWAVILLVIPYFLFTALKNMAYSKDEICALQLITITGQDKKGDFWSPFFIPSLCGTASCR